MQNILPNCLSFLLIERKNDRANHSKNKTLTEYLAKRILLFTFLRYGIYGALLIQRYENLDEHSLTFKILFCCDGFYKKRLCDMQLVLILRKMKNFELHLDYKLQLLVEAISST